MIYTSELEKLVFSRHKDNYADELIIISGYIGPIPVCELPNLGIKTTVVFGMYKEQGVHEQLHSSIVDFDSPDNSILYSNNLVHSKCYIWKKNGKITDVLVGSANFTFSGLNYSGKEILSEVSPKDFSIIKEYSSTIIDNSISCRDKNILLFKSIKKKKASIPQINGQVCELRLYSKLNPKQTNRASDLNWGFQNGHHGKSQNDAYIPIDADKIRNYPNLFHPNQEYPTVKVNNKPSYNEPIEVICDDGYKMKCLMESKRSIDGVEYPKQLSTFNNKAEMGIYFRKRLGVPLGKRVEMSDLKRYGRTSVGLSLIAPGVYFLDFSV